MHAFVRVNFARKIELYGFLVRKRLHVAGGIAQVAGCGAATLLDTSIQSRQSETRRVARGSALRRRAGLGRLACSLALELIRARRYGKR